MQNTWRQALYCPIADGTAVTAASETALVPDFVVEGGDLYPGAVLKYTLFGKLSTVITTPGTWTWKLRWGGVGAVSLCSTGAIAPDVTAASTNVAWTMEFYMKVKTVGTTGTALCWGRGWAGNDMEDVSVSTIATYMNNQMFAFPDAPADVTIDTTTNKALSATITPSVATGSITCHFALLESVI